MLRSIAIFLVIWLEYNEAFKVSSALKSLYKGPSALRAAEGEAAPKEPLLVRAARGEKVDRPPVWMMRQAGRHMKVYRELKGNKSFREISENVDLATEVSLQPWRAYGTDGCILFSDILTPLPGMGVAFDIKEREGPRLPTFASMDDVERISVLDPHTATPFVGATLRNLRQAVGDEAAVLGFVGLPFTLATYMVEGGPSADFKKIKTLAHENPRMLHELLRRIAANIAIFAQYQVEQGAQAIQIFDSWAGVLSPEDYDEFVMPYQKVVIDAVKTRFPAVPVILYIHRSGALLERMARSGVDIVSLDWTVSLREARVRMGEDMGIQGNLDPMLLFAPNEVIKQRTEAILRAGEGRRHIMNLGHGIEADTPEEKARFFIDTVKAFRY